jgi:hypothetical protein
VRLARRARPDRPDLLVILVRLDRLDLQALRQLSLVRRALLGLLAQRDRLVRLGLAVTCL